MFRVGKKSHLHLQCTAHFLYSGMYCGLVVWTILQNTPLQITLGTIRPEFITLGTMVEIIVTGD